MGYRRAKPQQWPHSNRCSGFSLVELVIVVVIIGIIAAIAVPRISRGAAAASVNSLEATLTNVRKAIEIYYAEHNAYPGYIPSTTTPDGDRFTNQLTLYSDRAGNTSATKSSVFRFGPYLRAPFPTNTINKFDTVHVKVNAAAPDPAAGTVGWVAVLSTGEFGISATSAELDDIGVLDPVKKLKMLPSL